MSEEEMRRSIELEEYFVITAGPALRPLSVYRILYGSGIPAPTGRDRLEIPRDERWPGGAVRLFAVERLSSVEDGGDAHEDYGSGRRRLSRLADRHAPRPPRATRSGPSTTTCAG